MRHLTNEGNINVHNYAFDSCVFTLSHKRIKRNIKIFSQKKHNTESRKKRVKQWNEFV